MIDGRGEVKITDFGLAGAAEDVADDVRAGTPAYMSPEQLDGSQASVQSDLYALGLVLFELFSGKPAFSGRSLDDFARRRETPPTSLSSLVDRIDPAVARIVDRCLAPDPADRPASAAAVAAALPGGDPLAAALAAGETPSPELVAEAGASGGLRPAAAACTLAAVLLLLAATAFVGTRAVLVSRMPLDLPPAVLSHEASELIRQAGFGASEPDRVHDWVLNLPYLRHLRDSEAVGRWDALARPQPPAMLFAYRESPEPLVRMSDGSVGEWMADPPSTSPGMVEVRLDTRGRLASFRAVPDAFHFEGERPNAGAASFDFTSFLRSAGFDPAALDPVEPVLRPGTYVDARHAWSGHYPDAPDVPVRIEAASLDGRPVSFRILEPWDRSFAETPQVPGFWERTGRVVASLWYVAVLVGATLVAMRNVRLGRCDHRTALRFGLYLGTARLLWMLTAHHYPTEAEVALIKGHLAWSAYRFVVAYVFYLALEPYARRLWPGMLVSWVRLFGGRLRDARVGRDILFGLAAGCAFALVRGLVVWVPHALGMRGYGLMNEIWSTESLRGVPSAVGALAGVHVEAVLQNLQGVMLFLVLRVVTRGTWIAVSLVTILATVMLNPGVGSPWPYLIGVIAILGLFWFVLFRAGLLSVLLMLAVGDMLASMRVTEELTAWHSLPMWIAYGSVAALAVWGFRAAVAGQLVFRDEIQAQPAVAR
jgi:serine/threonine-protein kinase